MTTRMLIDARHREETRVAVIKGNRIEEFDFESAEHKQLKGNIYLAKVTRVEPSLQAAFVDYGGNRHGFLAFSEIHPDYYQIPKEDREALLREEAEHAAHSAAMRAEDDLDALEGEVEEVQPPARLDDDDDDHHDDEVHDHDDADGHGGDDDGDHAESAADDDRGDSDGDEGGDDSSERSDGDGRRGNKGRRRGRSRDRGERSDRDEQVDFRRSLHRRYKIQDVIRRRQVILVQVVKEERGTKGAALTSYLSLAGRYCVLMPNSSHGGGISRKISNNSDRKRLKSIIDDLNLPTSMGCIVRTAGLERTKPEIKRDFDYLARLWDGIRETTLKSSAPALIHSDSDLIKRAIRDIYNGDIDEVSVEGDEGYRAAKDFMKLLMPSHARKVQQYADPVSLFQRYGVEDQLGAMYQPVVGLKSGGYLVINPTEALVSIDINSGRATREHNIEQTALNTNLEAAYEIARQLRLRDMAGLVVIDFIDMEVGGNVRKVERAMKDALKNDRARIQVGRISGFGLMEMSRQRLRTGVLEASTRACPHCEGTGLVRTASSAGLSALRLLEEEAARGRGSRLVLRASQEAAFYVLNNKRAELSAIEARYGVTIVVQPDGETEGARMSVEASGPPPANMPRFAPIIDEDDDVEIEDELGEEEDERAPERNERSDGDRGERGDKRRRRGRRRRGGRRDDGEQRPHGDQAAEPSDHDSVETDIGDESDQADTAHDRDATDDNIEGGRRRRRGRRGGRNRRGDGGAVQASDLPSDADGDDDAVVAANAGEAITFEPADSADADNGAAAPMAEEKPKRRRGKAKDAATDGADQAAPVMVAADATAKPKRSRKPKTPEAEAESMPAGDEDAAPKPKRARKADASPTPASNDLALATEPAATEAEPAMALATVAVEATPTMAESDATPSGNDSEAPAGGAAPAGDRRRGWWQRTFGN